MLPACALSHSHNTLSLKESCDLSVPASLPYETAQDAEKLNVVKVFSHKKLTWQPFYDWRAETGSSEREIMRLALVYGTANWLNKSAFEIQMIVDYGSL